MPAPPFLARRGAYAAARQQVTKRTVGEAFSGSTTPPGITVLPLNANAPTTVSVSGGIMREGNSGTSGSPFYTAVQMPEVMGTDIVKVTATNGAIANVDRAFGCGLSSADGTKMVFAYGGGNSNQARIATLSGGTVSLVGTGASTFFTSSSDILGVYPTLSGSDIVWRMQKNGVDTAVVWTDTGAAFGFPGRIPVLIFRHFYTGGTQYVSPGVRAWTAADL